MSIRAIRMKQFSKRNRRGVMSALGVMVIAGIAWAGEKRAPAPQFSDKQLSGVFFNDVSEGLRGERPSLSTLRGTPAATGGAGPAMAAPAAGGASAGDASSGWAKLISPVSLEDEVKRVRLRFDSGITTPGAFNGGGYQDARRDLSVLAALFAVISQYNGDVRWKDQAAAARDLLARSAFNCKAGSTQVYNEVKLRKNDLEDLVSGSGLANREAEPQADWSMIVDRSPLMGYLEDLLGELQGSSNNEAAIKSNGDSIRRLAEAVAVVGEILVQDGMDEADDDDYKSLTNGMTKAASSVAQAIERGDANAVREGIGAISQSCDKCHEQYR